jgi:hypothetical protein
MAGMSLTHKIALLLALASGLSSAPAAAQPAATLKFSWDHCSGEGQVSDRTFACNTNSGSDFIYASMVIDDGNARAGVAIIEGKVDVTTTAATLPAWWQVTTGSCRANAVTAGAGPFTTGPSCVAWYASPGPDPPVGIFNAAPGVDGIKTLSLTSVSALPPGSEATLPAGQELLLFTIRISHAKSTGTGSCVGCQLPTCIGFGAVRLIYAPGTLPDETIVGGPGSAVTWQSAFVAGYTPVPAHVDGGQSIPYHGNLACTFGAVPARGRTWGLIKSFYR